jgi:hypothetical protein
MATALQNKVASAVNYIAQQSPKSPNPPQPFSKDMWRPSPLELASLARKLEVLQDPTSVLKRLADGTLTNDHVQALAALYPKTYEDIKKAVIGTAALANPPQLNSAQRQKVDVLMGTNNDRLGTPDAFHMLQNNFVPPDQGGPPPGSGKQAKGKVGRPPKLDFNNLPNVMTPSQKSEYGYGKSK